MFYLIHCIQNIISVYNQYKINEIFYFFHIKSSKPVYISHLTQNLILKSHISSDYWAIATCGRATRLAALETQHLRIRRSADSGSVGNPGRHTVMEKTFCPTYKYVFSLSISRNTKESMESGNFCCVIPALELGPKSFLEKCLIPNDSKFLK